jgi:hypothetical protein
VHPPEWLPAHEPLKALDTERELPQCERPLGREPRDDRTRRPLAAGVFRRKRRAGAAGPGYISLDGVESGFTAK